MRWVHDLEKGRFNVWEQSWTKLYEFRLASSLLLLEIRMAVARILALSISHAAVSDQFEIRNCVGCRGYDIPCSGV